MRVTRYRLDEKAAAPLGLRPFEMSRLGQVVALAGPNGAGKSRFLKHLKPDLAACGHRRAQLRSSKEQHSKWVATAAPADQLESSEYTIKSLTQTVQRVGLIGDDDRQDQLTEFLSLPAHLATARFAAECLVPPPSALTGDDDPQANQIRDVVEHLAAQKGDSPLRVLDYGAGQGRILAAMTQPGSLDYLAFEKNTDDHPACRRSIAELYGPGDGQRRLFGKESDLEAEVDPDSVDVCILCNVLHEISPTRWLADPFGDNSTMMRMLSEDGYLLLVEDNLLSVGEMAHRYGFIILDTEHLTTLFKVTEEDRQAGLFVSQPHQEERFRDRLKAHLIHKSLLRRITADTRSKTLAQLITTAGRKVLELREAPPSYRQGRQHGFWTQQFTNAHLAKDELG